MSQVRNQLDHEAQQFGIDVVDVRIRRADLPEQNSQAVYQRMQTERQREAAEFRAQGSQKSQEIRAKADRDVTVLLADATSQAEQVRGQGDSERNRIFADAYNRDPDFFAFLSLHASLRKKHAARRYTAGLEAGHRLFPLLLQSLWSDGSADDGTQCRGTGHTQTGKSEIELPTRSPTTPSASALAFMTDFLAALGLVLAIEGILLAAFPLATKRAMAAALETPDGRLRIAGLVSALIGVVIVWLVRH